MPAGATFNFDTGQIQSTGGDVLYAGGMLTCQTSARIADLGVEGSSGFNGVTQSYLSALLSSGNFSQIPTFLGSNLVIDEVFAVYTNGRNLDKVLVTAASQSSITFHATFGVPGTTSLPIISSIQNNFSFTLPGLPNYGIAPGSIFIINGTGLNEQPLSEIQSSAGSGLLTTLNGTSITVTVNGVSTRPRLYYTSPTQIAAVLPSDTPVGSGVLTVTNAGLASVAVSILVVPSAFGLNTLSGAGSGRAVAQDSEYALITSTHTAKPGQTIILWGSGIRADTANDDRTYPQEQNNLSNITTRVEIGGISAHVVYHGRSQFPGLDQIVVTVPPNVRPGCWVSLVVQSGIGAALLSSNFTSIPVSSDGGLCSDQNPSLSQYETLSNQNTISMGGIEITQFTIVSSTGLSTWTNLTASFFRYTQAQFTQAIGQTNLSIGGGVVIPPTLPQGFEPGSNPAGLEAGPSISVNGPEGLTSLTRSNITLGGYGIANPRRLATCPTFPGCQSCARLPIALGGLLQYPTRRVWQPAAGWQWQPALLKYQAGWQLFAEDSAHRRQIVALRGFEVQIRESAADQFQRPGAQIARGIARPASQSRNRILGLGNFDQRLNPSRRG